MQWKLIQIDTEIKWYYIFFQYEIDFFYPYFQEIFFILELN
jgi:hypothetical protein